MTIDVERGVAIHSDVFVILHDNKTEGQQCRYNHVFTMQIMYRWDNDLVLV